MLFLLFFQIVYIDVDRGHPILRRNRISLTDPRLNHILVLRSVLVVSEGERPDSLRRVPFVVSVLEAIIFVDD